MNSSALARGILTCNIKELRLDITLACGQSFRWRELSPGKWTSVLCGRIWTLSQNAHSITYEVTDPHKRISMKCGAEDTEHLKTADISTQCVKGLHIKEEDGANALQAATNTDMCKTIFKHEAKDTEHLKTADISTQYVKGLRIKQEDGANALQTATNTDVYETILRDYFQLSYNLVDLYSHWSEADDHFRQVASAFSGVRMLRQDPVENLFAFICSSNNHISRISGMVERMCEAFGEPVGMVGGYAYHAFPTVERLAADGVEETLRELGFGYRARFIGQSARMICERGDGWLYSLRRLPYERTKAELMTLYGVGAKVADCVCLMSMDHLAAIPVDTHVWQIAVRDYLPSLSSTKSLTPTIYKQIGDHFRSLWGDLAGWTHSVLFSADLKKFQDLKPNVKKTSTKMQNSKKETKGANPVKSQSPSPNKRQQAPAKTKQIKRTKR